MHSYLAMMFPFHFLSLTIFLTSSFALIKAQEKPTFSIKDLPDRWEEGQYGSNRCSKWKPFNQRSRCQNVYVNSVSDFCLWAPAKGQRLIGDVEDRTISYCTKKGYGTRIFPTGTLKGAHFIKTKDFVQVTGMGDFTKIHIKARDLGGELDAHGADGRGNPHGGLIFTRNAKGYEGQWIQSKEWSNFMSATEFSIRACYGPKAADYCPHILDEMGSQFNHPGDYSVGSFDNCEAESGELPLIYHGKSFKQGDKPVPKAHKPGKKFNCRKVRAPRSDPARKFPYRRSTSEEMEFEDAD